MAGANATGGRGGSTMLLAVGDDFALEGNLWANANAVVGGTGTGVGGGSGGAIMLKVTHLKGYGVVSVNGGAGAQCGPSCAASNPVYSGPGGGGAGGRIAMLVSSIDEYRGATNAFGGGDNNAAEHLPAPGLVRTLTVPGPTYGGGYYQPTGEFWFPASYCGCACIGCPWSCICGGSTTTTINRYTGAGVALSPSLTLASPHTLGARIRRRVRELWRLRWTAAAGQQLYQSLACSLA